MWQGKLPRLNYCIKVENANKRTLDKTFFSEIII